MSLEVTRYVSRGCLQALLTGQRGNTWGLETRRNDGMNVEIKIKIPNTWKEKDMDSTIKENPSKHRYNLRSGKYGPYFFDNRYHEAMSLEKVLEKLNEDKVCPKLVGRQVMVFNRHLFAVPVKGTIQSVSSHDGSYQIVFQEGQANASKHDGSYFFPQECQLME